MRAQANYGILYEEVFAVSPEKSVLVAPDLTVQVRDRITGKLIEGALVTVNTTEVETDASGLAVLGELPAGIYGIRVSKSGYKGWSKTVTFEPGLLITVQLWPLWGIGLGVLGVASIGVIVIERVTRAKR